MKPLVASAVTGAPPETPWQLLTDTRRWAEWGPSVRDVLAEEPVIRCGHEGRVQTTLGVWLPYEITVLEPGRFWAWQVAGMPATGHRVMPLGERGTRIAFELPVWAVAYWPVCRLAAIRLARLSEHEAAMANGAARS